MIVLRISILFFIIMELSNVIIMYFKPDFKYGNSMKVFTEFERSNTDQMNYLFIKYMINWVANCKLIFICLLLVICIIGDLLLLRLSVLITIASISVFFLTLYPIIKQLDDNNRINPKGYSKKLSIMILCFMIIFSCAFILSFIL